jgi:CheY-like chemotaxis protein
MCFIIAATVKMRPASAAESGCTLRLRAGFRKENSDISGPDDPVQGGAVASHRVPIIVVDDEPDMQMFLSTLLEENGFEPIIAKNAVEGLEMARTLDPACIILNAMIPEDDGLSMYVNLKCDERLKTVPVIMLSAIAQKIYSHYQHLRSLPKGQPLPEPEAFLESPPDTDELLREIHRLARQEKPA